MKIYILNILLLFVSYSNAQIMNIPAKKTEAEFVLLDSFGTGNQHAFSFYKLSSIYTGNCIMVRRSSDNATQDISFSGNYLDTNSLKSFVGSNNGFVVRWYNQSPNKNDTASQNTNANQPRIVNAGVIDRRDGFVCLVFSGSQFLFTSINSLYSNINFISTFAVANLRQSVGSATAITTVFNLLSNRARIALSASNTTFSLDESESINSNITVAISPGGSSSLMRLLTGFRRRVSSTDRFIRFFFNNILVGSTVMGNVSTQSNGCSVSIAGTSDGRFLYTGNISEILYYNIDVLNNINRINTNINRRYRLY